MHASTWNGVVEQISDGFMVDLIWAGLVVRREATYVDSERTPAPSRISMRSRRGFCNAVRASI